MSCAHSDGWYAVQSEWFGPEDGRGEGDMPGLIEETGVGERDLAGTAMLVVGRCRIFAPNFGSGVECAEGLVVELFDDAPTPRIYGLYWAKPSRTFRLVPLRPA